RRHQAAQKDFVDAVTVDVERDQRLVARLAREWNDLSAEAREALLLAAGQSDFERDRAVGRHRDDLRRLPAAHARIRGCILRLARLRERRAREQDQRCARSHPIPHLVLRTSDFTAESVRYQDRMSPRLRQWRAARRSAARRPKPPSAAKSCTRAAEY